MRRGVQNKISSPVDRPPVSKCTKVADTNSATIKDVSDVSEAVAALQNNVMPDANAREILQGKVV